MRVVGVVCEYNPFHRGHALHLARAREACGGDFVVCAMSGAVTQRGRFARYDKWTRARAALMAGADLVLELPARFACAPAPEFAAGGVALLSSLGVVTHLSFGCESEALPLLKRAAGVLREEPPAFRKALREGLDRGLSYPRAQAEAAGAALGEPELADAIARPNAALALEYLRALPQGVCAVPIAREGAGYHDETLGPLSSASAVRAACARGELRAAMEALPFPEGFERAETSGFVHEEEALTQALLYALRTADAQTLASIRGMDEGLQNAFLSAAQTASSRDALILAVKSKRYTYARLSRACLSVLLGLTKDFALLHPAPTYARVLGLRHSARPLLSAIKKSGALPLQTRAARLRGDPLFAYDLRAQDLWSLGCTNPDLRRSCRDFITGPVIL